MINSLNRQFAITGHVAFDAGEGGLARAVVANQHASATVYLHGGHVTSFRPHGADEVLWLSERAVFRDGGAIRGGIPVCWPWFGPHPHDDDKPQHGFARNSRWEVAATGVGDDGDTILSLRLPVTAATRALWPHEFNTELTVSVGRELTVALSCRNPGDRELVCGGALHSYITVGDIGRASVVGLDGREYIDQLDGGARSVQQGDVGFTGNVDRIYLGDVAHCVVVDAVGDRRIAVRSSGSASTVVWNPWSEKAIAMKDFPDDGYRHMVCVEAANAATDTRSIAPGGRHVLAQTISLEGGA